jgi:hypothetical protein
MYDGKPSRHGENRKEAVPIIIKLLGYAIILLLTMHSGRVGCQTGINEREN